MLVKSTVAVALFAVSFAAAQTTSDPFANITVTSAPDQTTASQWCTGEFNTCNTLCSKKWNTNHCDDQTLNFTCTCTANNSMPGLQYYTQSMPTFICLQKFEICNKNAVQAANSAQAQADCASAKASQCGTLDPANFTAAAVSSSSSSSAASTPTASDSAAGSTPTSTSSKAAGATMAAVRNFGTGAFAVGAAVFGVLL